MHEQIRHALYTQTYGSVPYVRVPCAVCGVVRLVYDEIHVSDDETYYVVQFGVVELTVLDLGRQRDTG